ncbi:MAG: RluA family pseudouridine synthase [Candidatus Doudnabacteria bacterium]|nr:RluA family pseudouridine synthase [Candidatus Doudnabacteria bacterium]
MEFKVEKIHAGKRLDLYLTLMLPNYSRSNIRKLLDMGKVMRGEEVEYRPNYKVEEGDVFVVGSEEELQRKSLTPWDVDVEIVYKDKDLVLAYKPAGMNVHPTSIEDTESLINAVAFKLKDELTPFGVNLVNRIDKATSGLVALAISPEGAWHYAKQFAEGRANKTYLAVVSADWFEDYGEEEVHVANFIRYDVIRKRQVVVQTRGDHAETDFRWEKLTDDSNWGILTVHPRTGRTHQIRLHLESLGYPILGDDKYGGKEYPRLLLHAYALELAKLGGGKINVHTSWPKDLQKIRL